MIYCSSRRRLGLGIFGTAAFSLVEMLVPGMKAAQKKFSSILHYFSAYSNHLPKWSQLPWIEEMAHLISSSKKNS